MDLIDLSFETLFIALVIPLVFINSFFIIRDNIKLKENLYTKIQENEIHFVSTP